MAAVTDDHNKITGNDFFLRKMVLLDEFPYLVTITYKKHADPSLSICALDDSRDYSDYDG